MEFKNNKLLRQFECKCGDNHIIIEYSIQERKLFLTKLNPNGCQDEAVISNFIKSILDLAEEKRLRIVPVNSNIVTFFKKNPSYRELLAAGIKI
ncbi:N-acetyltransferase [Myroides sp. JBRI-B21084]|uniref:GNAT family N-acetyltransferase n=1 Tax=Myroides sp. JBRI-B21084 TaxID=3119977 RepID=UPI0026E30677|nr:N-acetyltransferase [Paenimyroides cloacae]WKW47587.1 N-acetyltransferase [Paenimyroides cloacae]